jgi:hypothetical protein
MIEICLYRRSKGAERFRGEALFDCLVLRRRGVLSLSYQSENSTERVEPDSSLIGDPGFSCDLPMPDPIAEETFSFSRVG